MRFLIGLILLAFPIAELMLLVTLGHRYGWWLILYLVVIAYLGLLLIRGEKQIMSIKMMQSMQLGGNPVKAMVGSARNMIAGVLLILPGVISDILAAILLLIPVRQNQVNINANDLKFSTSSNQQTGKHSTYQGRSPVAANDDIIEGEYTEIKETDNINKPSGDKPE